MSAEADRVQHALLGIGVNVHQRDFGPELAPIATSLAAVCGQKLSRPRLLAEILFRLEQWLDRLRREGRGPILSRLRSHFQLCARVAGARRLRAGGLHRGHRRAR